MSLKSFLKKKFKATLERAGYEIRNLNRLRAENAIAYNTAVYADRFYGDEKLLRGFRDYVPQHLENLRVALKEEGIGIHKDMAILDAGCGPGDTLKMLRDDYGCDKLTGTDFSGVALGIARENCPEADLHQVDMTVHLPQTFDLILCQQVLEHLVDPGLTLQNLASMLQPDGVIFIAVPDGRLDDFAGHIHFWSRDSLPLFLQKALPGWTVRSGALQDGVSLYATLRKA